MDTNERIDIFYDKVWPTKPSGQQISNLTILAKISFVRSHRPHPHFLHAAPTRPIIANGR